MSQSVHNSSFSDLVGPGRLFEGAVIINLKSRPERLRQSMAELARFGLDACVDRLNAYEHEYSMYGCSVSHLEAVRLARWKGWKSILIFEDDILFTERFFENARATLEDLTQQEWALFQFGMMNPLPAEFVSANLFRFHSGQAAHAFALHESAYDHLIENYRCELDCGNWDEKDHYPFDEYLNNEFARAMPCFAASKLLISQRLGQSDTHRIEVDYRHMMEEAYERLRVPARATIVSAATELTVEWHLPEHGEVIQDRFGEAIARTDWPMELDLKVDADESGWWLLTHDAQLVASGQQADQFEQDFCGVVSQRFAEEHASSPVFRGVVATHGECALCLAMPALGFDESPNELLKRCSVGEGVQDGYLCLSMDEATGQVDSSVLQIPGNANSPGQPTALEVLVFVTHSSGIESRVERLSAATAAMRLMSLIVNGHSLDGHGFREIARIARSLPAFEVSSSELAESIDSLVGELSSTPTS